MYVKFFFILKLLFFLGQMAPNNNLFLGRIRAVYHGEKMANWLKKNSTYIFESKKVKNSSFLANITHFY